MTCSKCQTALQPHWKRCPACGAPAAAPATCAGCGATLQPGWRVCPECEAPVGQPAPGAKGIDNAEGVMKADGDIVGGAKQVGDVKSAGGATVGGGFQFNIGAAGAGTTADLEYERLVEAALCAGGSLESARPNLESQRARLGLTRKAARELEQACVAAHGASSKPSPVPVASTARPIAAPSPPPPDAGRRTIKDRGGRSLEIERDHLDLRQEVAQVFERKGKREEAATEWKALAAVAEEIGDADSTVAALRHAIACMPRDTLARESLFRVLVEAKGPTAAIQEGKDLALTYRELGLGAKARDTYRRLCKLAPADPNLASQHAQSCVEMGDVPTGRSVLFSAARSLSSSGEFAGAQRLLRELLRLCPTDREAEDLLLAVERKLRGGPDVRR